MDYKVTEGNYNKFGVEQTVEGLTFTFVCEPENTSELVIYNEKREITEEIEVPAEYTRGSVRSVCLAGRKMTRVFYNYRINGKIQTDPYAKRLIGRERWNDLERIRGTVPLCGCYEKERYPWKAVQPKLARNELVLYKLHVRGFSMDAGIRGRKKGTFAAAAERIPYLKELGITAVELMPVYEFEEIEQKEKQELPAYLKSRLAEYPESAPAEENETRLNYWGYTKGFYFAPKASYSKDGKAAAELKSFIDTLHENGMECVMELYFGSGENPALILDALHDWSSVYRVDGFHLIGEGLPIMEIAADAYLSRTKIFLPYLPQEIWERKEQYPHLFLYNDEFLYAGRKLVNHQGGTAEEFCNQLRKQNETVGFVNYFSNQNGFTLADVFSYNEKHNEENGEENTDGMAFNFSQNCGTEGRTNRAYVRALRKKRMYLALAMTFLSQAVPLLLEGDEIANSQKGNNNAYCQDNKTGWVNWRRREYGDDFIAFVKNLATFRKAHPVIRMEKPMHGNDYKHLGSPDLSFHSQNAWVSSFQPQDAAFGVMYNGAYAKKADGEADDMVYIGYNFHEENRELALPKLSDKRKWYCVMDTGADGDPFEGTGGPAENQQKVTLAAQTAVILIGK